MMNKPTADAFVMSKVKVLKGDGLAVHYEEKHKEGNETFYRNYIAEMPETAHPDLTNKLRELRPVVARIYHLNFFRTLLDVAEFKGSETQKAMAEVAFAEVLDKLQITGVSLSGDGDNAGCIITAKFIADSNQPMALNSHCIKFKDTRYGFEEQVEQICDELKAEVYAYMYDGKRAQLALFGEDGSVAQHSGKMAAAGEKDEDE